MFGLINKDSIGPIGDVEVMVASLLTDCVSRSPEAIRIL